MALFKDGPDGPEKKKKYFLAKQGDLDPRMRGARSEKYIATSDEQYPQPEGRQEISEEEANVFNDLMKSGGGGRLTGSGSIVVYEPETDDYEAEAVVIPKDHPKYTSYMKRYGKETMEPGMQENFQKARGYNIRPASGRGNSQFGELEPESGQKASVENFDPKKLARKRAQMFK